jgi:cytochrome c biogenesis protein CcmG, thiol:disulfide interchange protein DsbE
MKRFLPLAVFLALVCFMAAGLGLNPREVPSPHIGKPAPPFALPQLQQAEKMVDSQDLRGKVWLFNVWASWCTACGIEHPVLMDMARAGSIRVVGLNYKDERSKGMHWLEKNGDPYLVSAYDADGRVGLDYGVYGVPETFVIDKRGIVRLKHTGPLTDDFVRKKLLPLLAELENA